MLDNIPVEGIVQCTDGPCGKIAALIINPVTQDLTHVVVVDEIQPQRDERIIEIGMIEETGSDFVRLGCTKEELRERPSFLVHHYVPHHENRYEGWQGGQYQTPYVTASWTGYDQLDEEQVPVGELAIHPGARVQATDGHVGEVEEFVVDAESGHLTHLVLREGHLWGKKDVTVPLSVIDFVEEDTIYLNIDKKSIESYPSARVKRHYR